MYFITISWKSSWQPWDVISLILLPCRSDVSESREIMKHHTALKKTPWCVRRYWQRTCLLPNLEGVNFLFPIFSNPCDLLIHVACSIWHRLHQSHQCPTSCRILAEFPHLPTKDKDKMEVGLKEICCYHQITVSELQKWLSAFQATALCSFLGSYWLIYVQHVVG